MRILILFLVSAVTLSAQIGFQCMPSSRDFGGLLFKSNRMSKVIRHWTCTFTNFSDSTVLLTEGDAVAAMISENVNAYPAEYVRVLFERRIKTGFWKTFGRIAQWALQGAIIFAGAQFVDMGEDTRLGIILGAQILSRVPDLAANRAPSITDFERMAWEDQKGFETSVVVSMFAAPGDNDKPIRGIIERFVKVPLNPVSFEAVSWPTIDRIVLSTT